MSVRYATDKGSVGSFLNVFKDLYGDFNSQNCSCIFFQDAAFWAKTVLKITSSSQQTLKVKRDLMLASVTCFLDMSMPSPCFFLFSSLQRFEVLWGFRAKSFNSLDLRSSRRKCQNRKLRRVTLLCKGERCFNSKLHTRMLIFTLDTQRLPLCLSHPLSLSP